MVAKLHLTEGYVCCSQLKYSQIVPLHTKPMPLTPEELLVKSRAIQMLVMDVDGTLTDGAMYYGPQGDALKRFATRDGMGLQLLRNAGFQTGIITSENSPIVTERAKKLQIHHVELGSRNKPRSLQLILEKTGLTANAIAYIGDDVNDIHVMEQVGLCACPNDAVEAVKNIAHYICIAAGGNGAVREFCELLLHAQGKPVVLPVQW